MKKFLSSPVWQGVGVIVAIITFYFTVFPEINIDEDPPEENSSKYQDPLPKTRFSPDKNKTLLMCDDKFKFYYDSYDILNNKIILKVNGHPRNLSPGKDQSWQVGDVHLIVSFLEYNKESNSPVLFYICSN